jgi:alanine racemase
MNTYAEINLEAVKQNIREIRGLLKPAPSTSLGVKFMAVVKANAYGHGAVAVSQAATEAGADYLAVAHLKEALELRKPAWSIPSLFLPSRQPR